MNIERHEQHVSFERDSWWKVLVMSLAPTILGISIMWLGIASPQNTFSDGAILYGIVMLLTCVNDWRDSAFDIAKLFTKAIR